MQPPGAGLTVPMSLGGLYIQQEECQYVAVATTASPQTQRHVARAVADVAGLDRVLWQRLSSSGRHSVVAGIRRRRPAYVTVNASTAAELRNAGLPTVGPGEGHDR